ncbi:MAG: amino acid adenylation domain-containing protein, partial [Acidobacteria bacterium]|nr:amino acid adenylation domain-containing protein [Acidobacteriota bacterium]
MSSNPQQEAAGIDIISEAERKQLLFDFNRTDEGIADDFPVYKSIHQLFESQLEKTPDHIAVFGHGQTRTNTDNNNVETLRAASLHITYLQLNEQSNQLAHSLIEKGAHPDCIIGIMMERSVEMIVAIMGILKSGSAYLPIDPLYPGERIDYMLKDSAAKILLTAAECVFNFHHSSFIIHHSSHFSHLAYIIYTSGSTGRPKGVMVEHGSVINILQALQRAYPLLERDSYLLKTSFLFDVSIAELFGWFIGGGRLAVLAAGSEKDPLQILAEIEKMGITHINFVPSMFRVFIELLSPQNTAKLNSLKYIFLAGEALMPETVHAFQQWNKKIRLENIYGPTEGTVYSSRYSLSEWPGTGNIPIGKPIDNIQLYILNKYRHLQPIGVPGELYIAGAGIARGYLNNPELTRGFFEKPPAGTDPEKLLFKHYLPYLPITNHQSPIYRTGDLARWLPDGPPAGGAPGGVIEYLGRIDQQVKIRGFRIELGEIENCLRTHQDIKEAVVLQEKDAAGELCLQAYIVYKGSGATGENTQERVTQLRQYLSKSLPNYMVPAYFHKIEQ